MSSQVFHTQQQTVAVAARGNGLMKLTGPRCVQRDGLSHHDGRIRPLSVHLSLPEGHLSEIKKIFKALFPSGHSSGERC